MGWRDFLNPPLVEKAENKEFTPSSPEQIPPDGDSGFPNSDTLGSPSDAELKFYQNLLEIIQSPKFGMDRQMAEREAWEIVTEYRLRKKQRKK